MESKQSENKREEIIKEVKKSIYINSWAVCSKERT